MKTQILFLIIPLLFFYSCSDKGAKQFDNQNINENKFKDTNLQEIYNFQHERNTEKLIEYFDHSNPINRETAVLAFGSVQDIKALNDLIIVLEADKSEKVRMAAAFAIGQLQDSLAQNQLIQLFKEENSTPVKAKIAEAIGKCGSGSGLKFLVGLLAKESDIVTLNGILSGISRYSLRGIFSYNALERILQFIIDETKEVNSRYLASISLARLNDYELSAYVGKLERVFESSKDIYTKLNIISALSKTNSELSFRFLERVVNSSPDYRLKVNAIRSLAKYKYNKVNSLIYKSLSDSNTHVVVQASEYFISNGINKDAQKYFNLAKKSKNWRVRTNLFTAAIKYTNQPDNFALAIQSGYKISENTYEKANLLKSLGGDISSYKFVNQEVQNSKEDVIRTYGMEALVKMRRNPEFNNFNENWKNRYNIDLIKEFAFIFKDAIMSGDIALISIAAEIIRDPKLNFREQYENTYFLTQALTKCRLPRELEADRELRKTITFMDGREEPDFVISKSLKIDWEYVSQIPYNQQVEIVTNKGIIQLELYVNQAPVSVANFLKLAEEGFYNNRPVHRVVPNFVVQDGCPRGDGWGGPDYSICSEFAINYYAEGSLGMASAGKDTESSQWFITHSPTPHLDGRYTNFGKVIKGMEIVHQLEVGDHIVSVEALDWK